MSEGYRSLTGWWLGGLGAAPPGGGYRSTVGFWLGGLSALPYTAPAPNLNTDGAGMRRRIRQNKIRKDINDDDDIIIEVSKAFLGLVR